MSKNEVSANTLRAIGGKLWAKNCIWPAPLDKDEGIFWDEDIIPDELNENGENLVEILNYYDDLVEEGVLDEDYCLINDEDDFEPEKGEDFWDGGSFMIDLWRDELTDVLNRIKIDLVDDDPVSDISNTIGYRFVNENLLRQAFTRRTYQTEYKLSGCSEELEFIGDSVLSSVVTGELVKHFTRIDSEDTAAPFKSDYDEGELSRLRSHFVCKEYLGKRCEALGLDKYILCGTGDECDLSAKEDAMEALIAAVAIDSGWDKSIIEDVTDRLVDIQIDQPDRYLRKSYYELLNGWHRHFFHDIPEYSVYRDYYKSGREHYSCVLKFLIPENDDNIPGRQVVQGDGDTRSIARENAARQAYSFIYGKGLWLNLKNAEVVPDYDSAINQLQELWQKKYIEKPEYDFRREGKNWYCNCNANGVIADCRGRDKVEAKKKASYEALVKLLRAAGCCKKEWYDRMFEIMFSGVNDCTLVTKAVRREGIKYSAVTDILKQVEPGKVISDSVLERWLSREYGIEDLRINWKEFPYPNLRDEDIPFHRFITARGLIGFYYKDRLAAEGHRLQETKTDNWKVLDYKETMVDVKSLRAPDREVAIGPEEAYIKW